MSSQATILYLDQNEQDINRFTAFLKNRYTIYVAKSIDEGKKILDSKKIQVLLIDQIFRQSGDSTFLEFLYSHYPNVIPIFTGYQIEKELILQVHDVVGIYKFVPKPWQKDQLVAIMERCITTFIKRLENQKKLDDLQFRCKEMNMLHKISQEISKKKPLPTLLNEIMESSKKVMNAEASSLLLYDSNDKKLHFKVATGEKGKTISKYTVDIGVGIAGWVAKHRQPLLISDCYSDPRFSPEYDKITRFKTQSMICVPLIRKKQLLGVMQVLNKRNGAVFEESDLTIFETLASQCAIAIENATLIEIQIETEALERELETARDIQQKLLPSFLPQYHDIEIAAKLIPAELVGGDYYNIFKIDQDKSLFFITDVSGKGIPSALIVSTIDSCLTTYLNMNKVKLNLMDLVNTMNKVLVESTTIDKYATCWFGLFDHNTQKMISINAGHNSPLLFSKTIDAPRALRKGGIFLGSLTVPFEMEEFQLSSDDILIFFTDGVTEAWNEKNEDYEEKRLIDVVSKHRHRSAEEILSEIEQDVKKHVGSAEQSDDFTCAVVKVF